MKIKFMAISALLIKTFTAYSQTNMTDTAGITLKEVTVSVNKVAETRQTVAQQINVITAKEIENTQAQSSNG